MTTEEPVLEEFEDDLDAMEEDVILADDEIDEDEEMDEQDEDEDASNKDVYLPGNPLQEGETLEVDLSAYDVYHTLNVEWPCLSFDIIKDSLGDERRDFPCTTTLITGSQASDDNSNILTLIRLSNLSRTVDHDEMEEDVDDGNDKDLPVLHSRSISHTGGVNRIRCLNYRSNNEDCIFSSWSDTGKVFFWRMPMDFDQQEHKKRKIKEIKPFGILSNHKSEGFALDWSRLQAKCLSGDCNGQIYLSSLNESQMVFEKTPFSGHTGSVEDLQWSTNQESVFASSSVDQTIKIWDTRSSSCALSVKASNSDINVISWNLSAPNLLASGNDDGNISIWDMRFFQSTQPSPVASFDWHKQQVTSIEWHPTDSSVLAASGGDDQISIWDFSLEKDDSVENDLDIPAQLLFCHQGQQDIKELHWHPQIPGLIISTAFDGFNVFKTISV